MRSRKRIENGGSSPIPRAHEKVCKRRSCLTVPRTGTGALAEKAKPCRENPGKGTRQVGPVPSEEGVPDPREYLEIRSQ